MPDNNEKKKVTNPYARKGSPAHRDKIDDVADNIIERGLNAVKEYFIRLVSGKGKFIDVVALNDDGNPVIDIQGELVCTRPFPSMEYECTFIPNPLH